MQLQTWRWPSHYFGENHYIYPWGRNGSHQYFYHSWTSSSIGIRRQGQIPYIHYMSCQIQSSGVVRYFKEWSVLIDIGKPFLSYPKLRFGNLFQIYCQHIHRSLCSYSNKCRIVWAQGQINIFRYPWLFPWTWSFYLAWILEKFGSCYFYFSTCLFYHTEACFIR